MTGSWISSLMELHDLSSHRNINSPCLYAKKWSYGWFSSKASHPALPALAWTRISWWSTPQNACLDVWVCFSCWNFSDRTTGSRVIDSQISKSIAIFRRLRSTYAAVNCHSLLVRYISRGMIRTRRVMITPHGLEHSVASPVPLLQLVFYTYIKI